MENWAETQMLNWNSQWGKKAYFPIAPLLRKLSTMLCRHFHHVPPRKIISSAPAVPSSWSSGGWQGFQQGVRIHTSHQHPWCPTKPFWQMQALTTSQISDEEQCPPAWLASHARSCLLCWPGARSELSCGLWFPLNETFMCPCLVSL